MNKPDFTMYVRGTLYAVTGFIERGDPSVGLFGDYYIVDRLVNVDTGEEASQAFLEGLTEGEQECISDTAYTYRRGPPCKESYWREAELEAEQDRWYTEQHYRADMFSQYEKD